MGRWPYSLLRLGTLDGMTLLPVRTRARSSEAPCTQIDMAASSSPTPRQDPSAVACTHLVDSHHTQGVGDRARARGSAAAPGHRHQAAAVQHRHAGEGQGVRREDRFPGRVADGRPEERDIRCGELKRDWLTPVPSRSRSAAVLDLKPDAFVCMRCRWDGSTASGSASAPASVQSVCYA